MTSGAVVDVIGFPPFRFRVPRAALMHENYGYRPFEARLSDNLIRAC
jgi:hypothetical protein